jgi:chromosome partitioning protein
MRVVSFAALKGGVGKSTVATNVALLLAERGYKTLFLDLDPQASSTHILLPGEDIPPEQTLSAVLTLQAGITDVARFTKLCPNLMLAPAHLAMFDVALELASQVARETRIRTALEDVHGEADVVIVDTPPGRDLLQLNAVAASSDVVLVTDPSPHGARGLEGLLDLVRMCRKLLPNPRHPQAPQLAGVVMCRLQAGATDKRALEALRQAFGEQVLGAIPHAAAATQAAWESLPVVRYAPNSTPAAALNGLVNRLEKVLGLEVSDATRAA